MFYKYYYCFQSMRNNFLFHNEYEEFWNHPIYFLSDMNVTSVVLN